SRPDIRPCSTPERRSWSSARRRSSSRRWASSRRTWRLPRPDSLWVPLGIDLAASYALHVTICAACGQENRAGASFCDSCGAPLAVPAETRELRKVVTILFCDVTGSTALGERLDSESLRRVMERYYAVARAVLERHGGTVEKFI